MQMWFLALRRGIPVSALRLSNQGLFTEVTMETMPYVS